MSAYAEIVNLLFIGFKFEAYPKVVAWMEKVGKNEGVADAHKVFFKLVNKANRNSLWLLSYESYFLFFDLIYLIDIFF